MKNSALTILLLTFSNIALAFSHAEFESVLKKYVNDKNLVAYAQLKHEAKNAKHELNLYINNLQSVSHEKYKSWSKKDQLAFLINAYNAFTLKLIVDNFPVDSIKDLGSLLRSPWKKEIFSMFAGKITTLDQLEHDWIRPQFNDHRIHAAVNCASIGCPVLRNEPYTGAKLDAQLDEQMKIWLSDPSKNKLEKGVVYVSKIFDWYGSDFSGGYKAMLEKYAPKEIVEALKKGADVNFMAYDWALNKQ